MYRKTHMYGRSPVWKHSFMRTEWSHIPHFSFSWYQSTSSQSVNFLKETKNKMHLSRPRYRPVSLSFWWNSRNLLGIVPQSQCTIHYECTGRCTCTDARQSENIHLCELSSHIPHFSFYWYQSTSSQSVKSLREKIKMHRCSPRYRSRILVVLIKQS